MARTTLNIETPILDEIRRLQRDEGRPLGAMVSTLLAEALAARRIPRREASLHWVAQPMGARVNLSDNEALWALLDREER